MWKLDMNTGCSCLDQSGSWVSIGIARCSRQSSFAQWALATKHSKCRSVEKANCELASLLKCYFGSQESPRSAKNFLVWTKKTANIPLIVIIKVLIHKRVSIKNLFHKNLLHFGKTQSILTEYRNEVGSLYQENLFCKSWWTNCNNLQADK